MNKFLSRLVPERMRKPAVLTDEERLKLLSTVGEHDPCLKAITDGLMKELESEFMQAIRAETDLEALRALQRLRAVYAMLHNIEAERIEAKEWLKRQG